MTTLHFFQAYDDHNLTRIAFFDPYKANFFVEYQIHDNSAYVCAHVYNRIYILDKRDTIEEANESLKNIMEKICYFLGSHVHELGIKPNTNTSIEFTKM